MRREDLRVAEWGEFNPAANRIDHSTRPVSDAELAELIESMGYVKASYPESMTLTDWQALLAEAAENVAREWMEKDGGWVKRPVCGRCKGNTGWLHPDGTFVHMVAGKPCPSCGGTGFGRMLALDGIDGAFPVVVMGGLSGAIYRAQGDDEPDGWFVPLAAIEGEDT